MNISTKLATPAPIIRKNGSGNHMMLATHRPKVMLPQRRDGWENGWENGGWENGTGTFSEPFSDLRFLTIGDTG